MQKTHMYIRFESPVRDSAARCNQGMFCSAYDIWYDRKDLHALWQVAEMRRMLDWFNEHLNEPARLYYRPSKKAQISGVCWFRTRSSFVLSQGRYLAWLLQDLGQPITERRSRNPGRILWKDTHQIVASPHLQ